MKKRLLAMAIVAMMVTGCGANGNTEAVTEQSSAAEQTSEVAAATEQTSEVAAATEQTSEVAAATEQTSEETATEQASEQASEKAATEQASKDTASGEQASADLKDGIYNTNLIFEPYPYSPGYVKSITVTDDAVILEGDVYQYDDNWKTIDFGSNTYTLPINADTQYLSSGGEEEAKHMTKDEFTKLFPNTLGSGLGFGFEIKDGYVVKFDIYS